MSLRVDRDVSLHLPPTQHGSGDYLFRARISALLWQGGLGHVRLELVTLISVIPAFSQAPPVSSDRPWHTPGERQIASKARRFCRSSFRIDGDKSYSLAELIDLAEAHNPQTRVARENARAQAAGPRNRT